MQPTVRVADGEPGVECQLDFGRLGLVPDPDAGRRRVAHALIFTAVYSRHMFVWLSFSQTLPAVIAGCEAAWGWFGGYVGVDTTIEGPGGPRWRRSSTWSANAVDAVLASSSRLG